MGKPLRVLIVEDSENDSQLLIRELQRGGYEVSHERVDTAEGMNAALDREVWEIAFGDYSMPHFNGVAALRVLRGRGLDIPFIFVSGTIGEDTAVEAMRSGANDYIMKGHLKRLVPAVERELREAKVRQGHRQAEELVKHLAYYDRLTALPNRTLLLERLQEAIRRGQPENHPLALILMDLDRFKEINDTLGHHRGDLLLQEVGSRLRSAVLEPDLVARLGGDEFAVLLPRLLAEGDVQHVTKKIQEVLESPIIMEGLPIMVEASIGVAIHPDHGSTAEVLMQRADVAMYTAKKSGVGCVTYTPEMDEHSSRRLALMGELRRAIDQNQLSLHYQPKIDFKTGRVTGVEVLVRWKHPEHGYISPIEFIVPAERTGLIQGLTLWIFKAAQRQCLIWHQGGYPLEMFINLSARNLQDPALPPLITRMMREYDVPTGTLGFEITETAIMNDPKRARDFICHFKPMGVRFSIDDFGTGYSSLGNLKNYPVDEIKVDRAFVANMVRNKNDAAIVRTVVNLGHNMDLQVVAEGVEDQETYDLLVEMGCDAGQGYYMGRPMPAEELARWMSESPWGLK
ncbi:MAG TPA: EAL domain-containing protein [Nitrospiria bacterium]